MFTGFILGRDGAAVAMGERLCGLSGREGTRQGAGNECLRKEPGQRTASPVSGEQRLLTLLLLFKASTRSFLRASCFDLSAKVCTDLWGGGGEESS